jgi:hypothetical protein
VADQFDVQIQFLIEGSVQGNHPVEPENLAPLLEP